MVSKRDRRAVMEHSQRKTELQKRREKARKRAGNRRGKRGMPSDKGAVRRAKRLTS